MKSLAFWILDASVLFALSLIYLYQGFHRKNQLFTFWLCAGVCLQLLAAWGLAAGWPSWMDTAALWFDAFTYAATAAVLILAFVRRQCPVNRSILWGLGAMVLLNGFWRYLGGNVDPELRTWLRNISFFGPAIFMLIALSNLRADHLPLWIHSLLRLSTNGSGHAPAFAAIAISTPPAGPKPVPRVHFCSLKSANPSPPFPASGIAVSNFDLRPVHAPAPD